MQCVIGNGWMLSINRERPQKAIYLSVPVVLWMAYEFLLRFWVKLRKNVLGK